MIQGKNEEAFFPRKLRMGMVGGGRDAFIGAVHRRAACLEGGVELIAGAFSSTAEKSKASGRDLYLDDSRVYGTWQEMVEVEAKLPSDQRLDFVSVVVPNHMHYPIIISLVEAGFNVVTDKPLCHTVEQARSIVRAVKAAGVLFGVTYNYSGYPMVRQARHMVASGALGEIRKVAVEYPQGWLAERVELTGQKQAEWRTDPARCGITGAIGDLGSHAEHLMSYITGLQIADICADLTVFVEGRQLDDDGAMLLRFTNGAKGMLSASQVCTGQENTLSIRVWGTKAGLEWRQETPMFLRVRSNSGPEQLYTPGNPWVCEAAADGTRLPAGHPEAYIEAFANIYKNYTDTLRARILGIEPSEIMLDFPTAEDGARGVAFLHKVVESSQSAVKWTPFDFAL
ncbi:MAG: Gfo/Idh/MocA family oxidoreductase [Chloroflexi bacterium]|nr:Gfo/Idh/MocA family oxidoreductase [Chloroflexota bacterium]